MAKPPDPQNHEVFQEHPISTELLAELQTIAELRQYLETKFDACYL
jgi:hypothetical protein